jgi:tetratricopeptide (TPR) repeat protein
MDLKIKEVKMSGKTTRCIVSILLVVAVCFVTSSCKKLSINNLKANHHFAKANGHFNDKVWRLAIEEYEKALQYNPTLIDAYRYLGESYKSQYRAGDESPENLEKAEKALENLNKALELDPNNIQIVHSIGDMYDDMGNFEKAEEMFLKVLEMEPTNMDNYYVVAGFYKRYSGQEEGLEKRAEEMYLRRIETDPESPQGYAYAAQFYGDKRPIPEYDKAYDMHKRILELLPEDSPERALSYYTIGVNRFFKAFSLQNVLSRQQRIQLGEESEEALKNAIELDPNYADSYAYMNMLYRNVQANLFPDRSERYLREADRWMERFQEIRKREAERRRLEEELKKGAIK